jgi:glycosyltransferase involved in cell wall biosynthesis
MVGRIFDYNINANNKYFDIAINIFNKLIDLDYNLVIIGSNKSNTQYNYLKKLINNNKKITLITDASEDIKFKYLQTSKYYIQLTGINDKSLFNKEHFGISMVEAINYGCIPISNNEGYPSYIINNNINGYLINNSNELSELIFNIINNTNIPINNTIDIHNYSDESFYNNLYKAYTSNI